MRISRRSLAAAVVLGTVVAACIETEHLSSTAQKTVVFMPTKSYSFGSVPVGSGVATSPDPYFTIRANSDTDDDYVTSIDLVQPNCGSDFTLDLQPPLPGGSAEVYCAGSATGSGPALAPPPGGSSVGSNCIYVDYQFGAFFHPSQPGMQTCIVNVTTVPKIGGSATVTQVTLTGTGLQASYSMSAQPGTINFGDVPLNTTSGAQTVTVTNTGGSTIHVSGMNGDATHFLVSPAITGPYTLTMNQFVQFQVSCQAGAMPSNYMASLVFSTQATEGPVMQMVSLACNAAATSVSASPNPVDLGTHLMGDSPTTVPVTITNTATVAVTLDNFSFSGAPVPEVTYPSPPTGPIVVGMGSNTSVSVRYAPSTERDFGSLGTMVFTVNGMATSVPLVGGAHVASIGTNPGTLDFGPVCAGSNASLDLTVFANAGADVRMNMPTGPGTPFSATLGGTPPVTLMAHHANEATITTIAAPATSATPGDVSGTLQLATNMPGQQMVPINVHALVLAGGVSPSPGLVHFGPNDIGKPSPVQMVTLTNCGSADLMLSDVGFAGSNGDEFAVVSPADVHVTVAKTQSSQFLVVMNAKTIGPKTAQMVFTYPGGSQMVDLDGTGTGIGDTGGTKDRETYYACSTGSASGLLPAAFAALLLRRRRRR